MSGRSFTRILASGFLVFSAPFLISVSDVSQSFEERVLSAHNIERYRVGVAPLRWSASLALSAQSWADYLALSGRFEHAPESRISPQGENLWEGTKGYFRPEAMVDAWIREKRFFVPGVFPNVSLTGQVRDVGHYSQVIWSSTHEVGCARSANPNVDILVCRYAEAGNYVGEKAF